MPDSRLNNNALGRYAPFRLRRVRGMGGSWPLLHRRYENNCCYSCTVNEPASATRIFVRCRKQSASQTALIVLIPAKRRMADGDMCFDLHLSHARLATDCLLDLITELIKIFMLGGYWRLRANDVLGQLALQLQGHISILYANLHVRHHSRSRNRIDESLFIVACTISNVNLALRKPH